MYVLLHTPTKQENPPYTELIRCGLLERDAMYFGRNVSTFYRTLLSPHAELKDESASSYEMLIPTLVASRWTQVYQKRWYVLYHTKQHHIPLDRSLNSHTLKIHILIQEPSVYRCVQHVNKILSPEIQRNERRL
jgi:hypothetical protein